MCEKQFEKETWWGIWCEFCQDDIEKEDDYYERDPGGEGLILCVECHTSLDTGIPSCVEIEPGDKVGVSFYDASPKELEAFKKWKEERSKCT